MGFNELPPEVVLIILEYISTTTGLKGVCLLSKKFRAIAQPLLHHEIVLGPEDIPLSLLLLCRTIIICPFIAAQVQLLDIDINDPGFIVLGKQNIADAAKQRGLSVADICLIKAEAQDNLNLESTGYHEPSLWTTEAIIPSMLLLSRTPNLRRLNITLESQGLSLLIGLVQAQNNTRHSPCCLGTLESMHLRCLQDRGGDEINIHSITRFLSLLHLREIQISGYTTYGHHPCNTMDMADFPLDSLSVSTLILNCSSIGASGIRMLVKSCKALDAFDYEQCDYRSERLSPQHLYSLLSCQQSSLRVLHLSFLDDSYANSSVFQDYQFGSLKGFASLEFLTLDQVYLGHAPQLPASLKYLAIQNCRFPISQSLSYIAKLALNGQQPNLNIILLHCDIIYPGQMIGLPRRGATDVLFNEACQKLRTIFDGTRIMLRFESDLLEKTVGGYSAAFEYGPPGVFWPFIYLK